jgi:phosphoribosylformimino-5-aminoimidazole carboxamide ribotide isomerase
MQVIPAIDIRRGKCVRLIQGDVRDETVYSSEPVEIAKLWQVKGVRMIHVVDIDGALTGKPKNQQIITKIAKTLKINIEVGGGIRTDEDIRKYLNSDVKRVVLSTSVLQNDEFLEEILEKHKDRIVIAVDVKDDHIAVKGWKDVTSINAIEFIKKLEEKGVKRIIYTDINRDGVEAGPNFRGVANVCKNTNMKVIVSGGVTRMKNIERLMEMNKKFENIEGVIIGKALYTGKIELKEAVKTARDV